MAGEDLCEARNVREIISWDPSLGKWRSGPGYSGRPSANGATASAAKGPEEPRQASAGGGATAIIRLGCSANQEVASTLYYADAAAVSLR